MQRSFREDRSWNENLIGVVHDVVTIIPDVICSRLAGSCAGCPPVSRNGIVMNLTEEPNHEIITAPENRQERETMQPDLTNLIRNRHRGSIPQTCTAIRPESITGTSMIPPPTTRNPPQDKLGLFLTRSNGVMTRVRMVNATLRHLGIDCSQLDSLAGTGTVQLTTVQAMVRANNRQGTRSALLQFRESVISLRDEYRGVLVSQDLPGETAQGVLSVAQSLDVTAVKVKIS